MEKLNPFHFGFRLVYFERTEDVKMYINLIKLGKSRHGRVMFGLCLQMSLTCSMNIMSVLLVVLSVYFFTHVYLEFYFYFLKKS